ncbi:MAG: cyanase [Acidimicrobiales bacterium]
MVDRAALTESILVAKRVRKLTWRSIADQLGRPVLWTISALLGEHPMDRETAESAGALLGFKPEDVSHLQVPPHRGPGRQLVPTDPTLYRFYEALMVYGPAIRELMFEEFGDGIMSAINFSIDMERKEDPGGDRVVVTFNGKFLPYEWKE